MLKLNRFFFDQAISIDNALTTNQIIHQIINQVKEVVDYVNSLETDAHEYTDTKVLELKTQLEHQISELETFLKGYADTKLVDAKNYTDSEIANLRLNYIDVKVSEIYETITALESRLNAKIDLVDATLTNLIGDVRAELIELISKGGAIYSVVDGQRKSIQDCLYDIMGVLGANFGITWRLYDKWLKYFKFRLFTNLSYGGGYTSYTNIPENIDIDIFSFRATPVSTLFDNLGYLEEGVFKFDLIKDYGYDVSTYVFKINGQNLTIPPIINNDNTITFFISNEELTTYYNNLVISSPGVSGSVDTLVIIPNNLNKEPVLTYNVIQILYDYYRANNTNFIPRYNMLFNFTNYLNSLITIADVKTPINTYRNNATNKPYTLQIPYSIKYDGLIGSTKFINTAYNLDYNGNNLQQDIFE